MNNGFQVRYGLVVREASQPSIVRVDPLLSAAPILLGLTGLATTLLAKDQWMITGLTDHDHPLSKDLENDLYRCCGKVASCECDEPDTMTGPHLGQGFKEEFQLEKAQSK